MIITIIGCILLILGIVGTVIAIKYDFSYDKKAVIGGFSVAIAICGGVMIFICLGAIVVVHCTADNAIYNAGLSIQVIPILSDGLKRTWNVGKDS